MCADTEKMKVDRAALVPPGKEEGQYSVCIALAKKKKETSSSAERVGGGKEKGGGG